MEKAFQNEMCLPLLENSLYLVYVGISFTSWNLKMALTDATESVFTIPITVVPVVNICSFQYVLYTLSRLAFLK